MDLKKIVVAYDGSAGSHKALVLAVGLAARFEGTTVVVTSVVKSP